MMKGIFERPNLEDYYGEDGELELPSDFVRRDGQVYYVSDKIGNSPIGKARLTLYRWANQTPDLDQGERPDEYLAYALAECIGEVDRRNQRTTWLQRLFRRFSV
jgi:hypothetical protein